MQPATDAHIITETTNTSELTIGLVSQFGPPPRGVSPYTDALLNALGSTEGLVVHPIDYSAPYPAFLHPAKQEKLPSDGTLHWAKPLSWRRVSQHPCNILHLQHWLAPMASYLAVVTLLAKRAGRRVIITIHNPTQHESAILPAPFERIMFKLADKLIVHDHNGAKILRDDFGIRENHIVVIPHGIKVKSSPPSPTPNDYQLLNLPSDRRYVSIFGNLRGYKGIDILLSAWNRIAPQLPDTDLVIAGRLWKGESSPWAWITATLLGTNRHSRKIQSSINTCRQNNRPHIREGFLADKKIDALLRISAMAVFPYTHFNSQSGAACRAAGMGCPVLVSNTGGLPDLAINDSWIIQPGNPHALAAALREKLSDHDGLMAARQKQLEQITNHAWPRVAAAHATLYRELL